MADSGTKPIMSKMTISEPSATPPAATAITTIAGHEIKVGNRTGTWTGAPLERHNLSAVYLLNSQSILQQQSMIQLVGSLLAIPVSEARL